MPDYLLGREQESRDRRHDIFLVLVVGREEAGHSPKSGNCGPILYGDLGTATSALADVVKEGPNQI